MSRCVRSLQAGLFGLVLFGLSGCPSCAPGQVGEGVARLTVRNVGAMVSLVNANTACGFASADVLAGATLDGAVGSAGSVTFTVTDCEIDLGSDTEVSRNCLDDKTTASGKVTISATKTIGGILTGDAANPVVPGGPDAVTITIAKAAYTDFEVKTTTSESFLSMVSGSLSAVAKPRLAVSATNGACAIATPNVSFSDIVYAPSTVHVTSPDNTFDADVTTSDIAAQNGVNGDAENAISGTMTVFGSDVEVGGDGVLDADYKAATFVEGYTCLDDLASPESYVCADLTPLLATGASRLTIKMLGTIAGLVDDNDFCGFAAEAVASAATVSGTPGGQGSLTFTVANCALAFAAPTDLPADCNEDSTTVAGNIIVSGTKTITGRLTGNPESPIVPNTDQPAEIALTITMDGFRVSSTADVNALLANAGTLSGTVKPRVFVGAETGVCSVTSPNADFANVTWQNGDLLVTSASGSFGIVAETSALSATNGTTTAGSNLLAGTITIDGAAIAVPNDAAGLNPTFVQADFDDAWQCDPALAQPANASCGQVIAGTVAGGAASLSMRTLGTLASIADANCFSAVAPAISGGGVGDDGVTATFTLSGAACTLNFATPTVVATDCTGATTTVQGTAVVTGTKAITGFLTGSANPEEAIVPTSFKPAVITISAALTNFKVTSSTSTSALLIRSGTLAGQVQPRVALDPLTNACSITTPNVTFSDVVWTNGAATLTSGGNAFDVAIATSELAAQNGTDGTTTNQLVGTITADGVAVSLGTLPLDPAFDQPAFDAGYQCAANGSPVLVTDAQCSFRQVLGNAAARLLVKAVATAASVHDGNPGCGFADATPDTAPVSTPSATPPAPGTLLQTGDANCQSGFVADTTIATNCVGTETHATGAFVTTSSTKFVNGLFTGAPNPPFVPVTRDAATLTLNAITFNNWQVFDQAADDSIEAKITVRSGSANVVVDPVAGKNASASTALQTNVFNIKTGIAGVSNLTMASAALTIVSAGKTFKVDVTNVDLDAFVGAFAGSGSNDISGAITVDGEAVVLAPNLVDDYDQAAFDATYTCNPALGTPADVVPAN